MKTDISTMSKRPSQRKYNNGFAFGYPLNRTQNSLHIEDSIDNSFNQSFKSIRNSRVPINDRSHGDNLTTDGNTFNIRRSILSQIKIFNRPREPSSVGLRNPIEEQLA